MTGTQSAGATALEAQARQLRAMAARLEDVRRRLPRQTEMIWRGPAALVYWIALHNLVSRVTVAHEQLVVAASESRRAAATVTAVANG